MNNDNIDFLIVYFKTINAWKEQPHNESTTAKQHREILTNENMNEVEDIKTVESVKVSNERKWFGTM